MSVSISKYRTTSSSNLTDSSEVQGLQFMKLLSQGAAVQITVKNSESISPPQQTIHVVMNSVFTKNNGQQNVQLA